MTRDEIIRSLIETDDLFQDGASAGLTLQRLFILAKRARGLMGERCGSPSHGCGCGREWGHDGVHECADCGARWIDEEGK